MSHKLDINDDYAFENTIHFKICSVNITMKLMM